MGTIRSDLARECRCCALHGGCNSNPPYLRLKNEIITSNTWDFVRNFESYRASATVLGVGGSAHLAVGRVVVAIGTSAIRPTVS
jgi:hypothetical protein